MFTQERPASKSLIIRTTQNPSFQNGLCNTAKQSREYKTNPEGTVTMQRTFSATNGRDSEMKFASSKPAVNCRYHD